MIKAILLSHNDMDGYGCNFTAHRLPYEFSIINAGYGNVDEKLLYIENMLSSGEYKKVFITDLNFSELQTIELYRIVKHNKNTDFIYIDHHPFSTEKQKKVFDSTVLLGNFKILHSEKRCATYIFYKYALSEKLIDFNEDYDKIMTLIDAYDTWKTDIPLFKGGLALNDIFYDWKRERFLYEMTSNMKISDKIKQEMKAITTLKNEEFKRLEQDGRIIKLGEILLFLSDKFISHMTIDYPDFNYYINGRTYGSISVRLSEKVENPEDIKNSIINHLMTNPYVLSTGGHDRAFGITLQQEHKDKMLSVVESVTKHIAQLISK